eukprot:g3717.t1
MSSFENDHVAEEKLDEDRKANALDHQEEVDLDESEQLSGWSNTSTTDINDDLKQQCIDLKKQIYERWEKSILRKTKFSPVVEMREKSVDVVESKNEGKEGDSTSLLSNTDNYTNISSSSVSNGIRWKQYPSSEEREYSKITGQTKPGLNVRGHHSGGHKSHGQGTGHGLQITSESNGGSMVEPFTDASERIKKDKLHNFVPHNGNDLDRGKSTEGGRVGVKMGIKNDNEPKVDSAVVRVAVRESTGDPNNVIERNAKGHIVGTSIQDIYSSSIDFRKQRNNISVDNIDYMDMANKGQSSRIENLRHLRNLKNTVSTSDRKVVHVPIPTGESAIVGLLNNVSSVNDERRVHDERSDQPHNQNDSSSSSISKQPPSSNSPSDLSGHLHSRPTSLQDDHKGGHAGKRIIPPPFPLYNGNPAVTRPTPGLNTSSGGAISQLATGATGLHGNGGSISGEGGLSGSIRAQEEIHMHNQNYIPPKTGISIPMITPPPVHLHQFQNAVEPILPLRPNIVSDMLLRDAQRVANSESSINRVVFDSIEMNPETVNSSSSSADSGNDAASSSDQSAERMHCVGTDPSMQSSGNPNHPQSSSKSTLKPYMQLNNPNDTTLLFESRFESGNLRRAIQISDFEYDLVAKPDINTRGHTQWYYFQVRNTRKGVKYKFNMINLLKPDSLYNQGMRPVLYSEKEALRGIGWRRYGTEICYYQNHIKRKGSGNYYTFTFTIEFPHSHDVCYLAYCYPYTYTDLQRYLTGLEADPKRRNRFRRRTLCQSLAGNNCDLLTVTSFACDPEALKTRKGVVVTGRVHPGETNASWMMKGLIDYLTGPSLDAKILRDNFVFKIVPMLNVDGVIVGNYRCSLAGVDLNRNWLDPSRKLHPTIFYTKQMMKRFANDREVILYTDLHGHSRKMNIFMYGCSETAKQRAQSLANAPEGFRKKAHQRLSERIFPRILWRNSACFSFSDCSFRVQKQKETTARIVIFRELNLTNSYTMEASFCGADFGRHQNVHFSTTHYEEMGHYFCDTILDYCDPDQSKVQSTLRELEMLYPRQSGGRSKSSSSNTTGSGNTGSNSTSVSTRNSNNSDHKGGRGSSSHSATNGLTGPDDNDSDSSVGSDYEGSASNGGGSDRNSGTGTNKSSSRRSTRGNSSSSSSSIVRKKSRSRGSRGANGSSSSNGVGSSSHSATNQKRRSRSKSSTKNSNSQSSSSNKSSVSLAVQSLDINQGNGAGGGHSNGVLYAANSNSSSTGNDNSLSSGRRRTSRRNRSNESSSNFSDEHSTGTSHRRERRNRSSSERRSSSDKGSHSAGHLNSSSTSSSKRSSRRRDRSNNNTNVTDRSTTHDHGQNSLRNNSTTSGSSSSSNGGNVSGNGNSSTGSSQGNSRTYLRHRKMREQARESKVSGGTGGTQSGTLTNNDIVVSRRIRGNSLLLENGGSHGGAVGAAAASIISNIIETEKDEKPISSRRKGRRRTSKTRSKGTSSGSNASRSGTSSLHAQRPPRRRTLTDDYDNEIDNTNQFSSISAMLGPPNIGRRHVHNKNISSSHGSLGQPDDIKGQLHHQSSFGTSGMERAHSAGSADAAGGSLPEINLRRSKSQ